MCTANHLAGPEAVENEELDGPGDDGRDSSCNGCVFVGEGVVLVWYSEVFAFPAVTVIEEVLVGNGSRATRTTTVTNSADLTISTEQPVRTTITNEVASAPGSGETTDGPTAVGPITVGPTIVTNIATFATQIGNSLQVTEDIRINYGSVLITNGVEL